MTPMTMTKLGRHDDERVSRWDSVPFALVHLAPLLLLFTGISTTAVVLFLVTYWGRLFFVTGGYHRYFSHRTYKLNRFWQFVFAFAAESSAQKGVLWWASHHREHHQYSDTDLDVHSPRKGFWWSHVGWILCDKYKPYDSDRIRDFERYPELRWINKHDSIAPVSLAIVCLLIGGWSGLLLGFFASTVLLWHTTFLVNSVAHVFGRRRFPTTDTSRNSLLIALLTWGEGWHNNHHHYQASCRQGFYWWEIDLTWYVLKALSWIGIVKDMKRPPARVLDLGRAPVVALDDAPEREAA
jgi:stearoyl-CoA desaturase (Delta-9 desaturase)